MEELIPRLEPLVGGSREIWIDVLIVLGCSLLVGVVLFIWARYFRSTGAPRRQPRSRSRPAPVLARANGHEPRRGWLLGKRRRQRIRYENRNATLAETRGLPPVRLEEETPPDAPGGAPAAR